MRHVTLLEYILLISIMPFYYFLSLQLSTFSKLFINWNYTTIKDKMVKWWRGIHPLHLYSL